MKGENAFFLGPGAKNFTSQPLFVLIDASHTPHDPSTIQCNPQYQKSTLEARQTME
jgi:hypothetical protein